MHGSPIFYLNEKQEKNQIKKPIGNIFCIWLKQRTLLVTNVREEKKGQVGKCKNMWQTDFFFST
jgi:hypothetical protein